MTETQIQEWLANAIDLAAEEDGEYIQTRTFEESGVLTTDKGIVLRRQDGTEFYLTIQENRRAS